MNDPQTTNTTEIVREELKRILSSREFTNSPLLSKFLRFVVEQSLSGRQHEIKEYTIGVEVLGKPSDFSPKLEATVRIHAIRLRRLLKEYYQDPGLDPIVKIELHKGSYKPVFVYKNGSSDTQGQLNKNDAATQSLQQPVDTICIVPFNGFINHEAIEYSIDHFCETLNEKLCLFQDISLVPFYEVTAFLQEGNSLLQLGDKLGVNYYLAGSIEVEGNHLLVSIQLFEAKSNTPVWTQEFDANLAAAGIFKIMDDITGKIVSALAGISGFIHFRKAYTHGHQPQISNSHITGLFWFQHYLLQQSKTAFNEAVKNLQNILHADPNCPECWALLAHLYIDGIVYNYPTVNDPLSKAQTYVSRALSLNPNSQQAYLTKAWINIHLRNKEAALQDLDKCDSINPHSNYFKASICNGYAYLGEYQKCQSFLEKVVQLHPQPFWWLQIPKIFIALKQNDYEKLLFYSRKTGTSAFIYGHIFEMIALYYLNEEEDLAQLAKRYLNNHPNGLTHAIKMLPAILFDEDLTQQMVTALKQIKKLCAPVKLKTKSK